MLRIPIPAFYLSETKDGKYQVVDGLQRLHTIVDFLRNNLKLSQLEYLTELNNHYYRDVGNKKGIPREYVKNIMQTQINVNIISSKSPFKVKFDVFRRVNTGGKPLNNQEIRNCLSIDHTRKLIDSLAKSHIFKNATDGSVKQKRMEPQELVLRFIAFWFFKVKNKKEEWSYQGGMTSYIDEAIEKLNDLKGKYDDEIKTAFYQGMNNAFKLFGKYAFRKCMPKHLEQKANKQLINKSLFTVWSVLLSQYKTVEPKINEPNVFAEVQAERLEENQDFFISVSYRTNDKKSLDEAFKNAQSIINEHLK